MVRIAAVVPAFNEEAALAGVVADLRSVAAGQPFELDVVVVDDCSTDGTARVAQGLDCVLLRLPVNLGIGGAVQTGLLYAWTHGYDAAVQVDGDGQHPASAIPLLWGKAQADGVDLVVGSRFLDHRGFQSTPLRRLGIAYFSWFIRQLTGWSITDSTSGLRLLGRRALALCAHHYPTDYPEPEALVMLARHGLRVAEVPVEMRARQGGQSSIHGWASAYYLMKVSVALLFAYVRLPLSEASWSASKS
jgi:glycosyltransferase involved in cell wall biosynthesis